MTIKRLALATASGFAALVIAFVPGGAVLAHEPDEQDSSTHSGHHEDNTSGNRGRDTEKAEDSSSHRSGDNNEVRTFSGTEDKRSASENSGKRLEGAKKKVCENRKGNVKTIMDRRVQWAERHIALFTTISERTQKFYAEKGKTLPNYDELVAAAASAKAAAEADLSALKATASFDCDADDPKGTITAYKAAFEKEKNSLKAYRTAVKNLIVGVKSVQGDA